MEGLATASFLRADMFPFPGQWGLEWLGLSAGRDFLRLFCLFWWFWFLDWGSEEARERFSGRKLDFMATLVSFVVLVGGFALGVWFWFSVVARTEWADVKYLCQTTANLSATECGLAGAVSLAAAWALARAVSTARKSMLLASLRFSLPLIPPLLAAYFCYSRYSAVPPRDRSFALVFAENAAVVAAGGAYLAATARAVWRRRTRPIRGGHWKRFVPRVFWLAFFAVFLRGANDFSGAFRLARICAGATVAGASAPERRGESAGVVEGRALDSSRCSPALSGSPAPSALQSLVDSAPAGAVVDVPAGTYAPICTRGKAITLRAVEGPERTVIDATLLHSSGVTNRCASLAPERTARRMSRLFDRLQHAYQIPLSFLLPSVGGEKSLAAAQALFPLESVRFPGEGEGAPQGGTVLEGFTLRGGHADIGGGALGGTLSGCVLEGNLAEFCGGGAFGSTLLNCTVRLNAAAWMGGGAWGGFSSGPVFSSNIAKSAGGAFGGGCFGGIHEDPVFDSNAATVFPDSAAARTPAK